MSGAMSYQSIASKPAPPGMKARPIAMQTGQALRSAILFPGHWAAMPCYALCSTRKMALDAVLLATFLMQQQVRLLET